MQARLDVRLSPLISLSIRIPYHPDRSAALALAGHVYLRKVVVLHAMFVEKMYIAIQNTM
jgi:hypothetical protein